MYIHEAIKLAMKQDACISRKEVWWSEKVKIKPTNTVKCCIAIREDGPPTRGWEPTAEDLMAEDWIVVKEKI